MLILFFSSTNSIQIVRRQCCLRSPQWDDPPRCRRERREENCWSGPPGGWRQLSSGTIPRLSRCFEGLRNAFGQTILWGVIDWNFVFQLTAPGCCQLHPRNLLQDVHRDILPISSVRFLWQQRQASLHALWRGIAWKLRSNIWWKILFFFTWCCPSGKWRWPRHRASGPPSALYHLNI